MLQEKGIITLLWYHSKWLMMWHKCLLSIFWYLRIIICLYQMTLDACRSGHIWTNWTWLVSLVPSELHLPIRLIICGPSLLIILYGYCFCHVFLSNIKNLCFKPIPRLSWIRNQMYNKRLGQKFICCHRTYHEIEVDCLIKTSLK